MTAEAQSTAHALRAVSLGLVGAALAVVVAGCATSPIREKNQAYDTYWQCTSRAVRPYVADMRVAPAQAALRAQAQCNADYGRFRDTQIRVVRDTVDADSADLAEQLGAQQALVWRRRVTQALTDYVAGVRRAR